MGEVDYKVARLRRTLLIITQAVMMALAFILGALTFTGLVVPWHILVLAFFLGIANAFDAPARQSFTIELVRREDLTNAISLNAAMFNTANIVGPAAGGLIYAWVGPGWCFTFNGLSFIAVILALVWIRLPHFAPPPRQNALADLKEGFQFIHDNALVRFMIFSIGLVSTFAFSLLTLIPAWAANVLGGDVRTNGILMAARGSGALLGALMLASLAGRKIRGKLWVTGSYLIPLGMIIFSLIRSLPLSLLVLGVIGWSMIALANTTNALVQSHIPDHLRGFPERGADNANGLFEPQGHLGHVRHQRFFGLALFGDISPNSDFVDYPLGSDLAGIPGNDPP